MDTSDYVDAAAVTEPAPPVAGWFALARRGDVVRRSLRLAAVIGSVLVAINHGDHLLAGNLHAWDWLKIVLTYCVPYCVSTYASVVTLRGFARGNPVRGTTTGP